MPLNLAKSRLKQSRADALRRAHAIGNHQLQGPGRLQPLSSLINFEVKKLLATRPVRGRHRANMAAIHKQQRRRRKQQRTRAPIHLICSCHREVREKERERSSEEAFGQPAKVVFGGVIS